MTAAALRRIVKRKLGPFAGVFPEARAMIARIASQIPDASTPRQRQFHCEQAADLTLHKLALSMLDMTLLVYGLMKPARPDTRRAQQRDYAMAYEHAYNKSLGDPAATLRTAKAWGISRRTVSNAVRRNPIRMLPDSKRAPELRDEFAKVRKDLGRRRVGNKMR
jgi:hypothetical protein